MRNSVLHRNAPILCWLHLLLRSGQHLKINGDHYRSHARQTAPVQLSESRLTPAPQTLYLPNEACVLIWFKKCPDSLTNYGRSRKHRRSRPVWLQAAAASSSNYYLLGFTAGVFHHFEFSQLAKGHVFKMLN